MIRFRERAELGRIDVEHGYQVAGTPKNRYDYLRPRAGITGNVIWKLIDVLNDDRLALSRSFTAYAFTKLDLETAEASLVWTDSQELIRLDDSIESGP